MISVAAAVRILLMPDADVIEAYAEKPVVMTSISFSTEGSKLKLFMVVSFIHTLILASKEELER